jgi:AAA domain
MSGATIARSQATKQAVVESDVAERFYNLFTGNERRHVKSFGPPVKGKNKNGEDKWKLKVVTNDGPASLALWLQHLDHKFILSIIPRLDNGMCWFACIDADEYNLDYHAICERISDLKFPLLPVVSKSSGLHLFIFFKEPVPAEQVIPALRFMAMRLRLKDYDVFPSSAEVDGGGNTRAVSMPYGAQWNDGNGNGLPEQHALNFAGNPVTLEDCLDVIEQMRIGADDLPQAPKSDAEDQEVKKIPLALQTAIDSLGPYPNNDRSPVTASIIWLLAERGFTAEEIQSTVEDRGPFVRYNENNRNLKRDIKKILERYITAHPDKADADRDEETLPAVLDAGDDLEKPPPRQWLLGNIFARKFLSSLFGDGGVGKTSLRYAQYMSMAVGRSLTGDHVFMRCRVLIVSLEDDMEELRRRIWALRLKYGISREDLKGWLFLWAPGAKGGKLMHLDKRGSPIVGKLRTNLESFITAYNIDFVGIDPFVKSHGVGENNNTAIDMVVQVLVDLSHKLNIGVDTPHHVSKTPRNGGAEPGDADRGRGASAMKDAARLVYTLNVMTKDESAKFGISEEDRWAYVRMDKGKVNIVPPSREARWFHLVNVPLGNADEMYRGDEVQAVESWTPPDVMGGISKAEMDEILSKINEGMADGIRYTDSPSAKTRAAWKVVVDVCPGTTEQQAREIIKQWVKNKVLVSKSYRNEKARKDEEGLYKGEDIPF